MKTLLFFSILAFSAALHGQDSIIKILNGSFESEVAGSENSIIDHWDTPGFYNESRPAFFWYK